MRFKIQFTRIGRQRMLPVDYQYLISAWIYKVFRGADPAFSEFLHSHGYTTDNKQFKLFCYSPLSFGKPKLWKEKGVFEITGDQLYLCVSFYLADAAEKFIIGLFNNQKVYLGDRFNGLDLEVSQIERLPEMVFTEKMQYRAVSPVVASVKTDDCQYAIYLSPGDEGYAGIINRNLINKYNAIPGNTPITTTHFFDFNVIGNYKSKLITLKPYTEEQSKVRGFVYDFSLNCPVEIHKMIVAAGFGEKNSTGFGWVEAIGSTGNEPLNHQTIKPGNH